MMCKVHKVHVQGISFYLIFVLQRIKRNQVNVMVIECHALDIMQMDDDLKTISRRTFPDQWISHISTRRLISTEFEDQF